LLCAGKLSDDNSEESTSVSSAPRHFRSKLEEALTAKQEFEAKVSTLAEKVKQYEAEIAELRLRVMFLSCDVAVRDNYNLKSHKYVCITTYQPDTKPNRTTKQHAVVNIYTNIVTCPTYPDKFIRDMLLHRLFDLRCNCHTAVMSQL